MDTIEYSVKGLCEEIALYYVLEKKGTSSREMNSADASNPGNPGNPGFSGGNGNGNNGNGNTPGAGTSSPYK